MSKPNNPPAFPVPNDACLGQEGMQLRDWFAGQALVGILSNQTAVELFGDSDAPAESASVAAYQFADAMLVAREAKEDTL